MKTRAKIKSGARRGATAVETAIVMLVLLTLVFGMLDLGVAIFRHHNLAQAARQGARKAIVHGNLSSQLGAWGPETVTCKASDPSPIAEAIRPFLVSLDLSKVDIVVEWLDGGNDGMSGHRVQVRVSAPYKPIMTFIFGNPSFTLRAESTMPIAH